MHVRSALIRCRPAEGIYFENPDVVSVLLPGWYNLIYGALSGWTLSEKKIKLILDFCQRGAEWWTVDRVLWRGEGGCGTVHINYNIHLFMAE